MRISIFTQFYMYWDVIQGVLDIIWIFIFCCKGKPSWK